MTGPQTSEAKTNLIPISVGQPIPRVKIILSLNPHDPSVILPEF